MNRIQANSPHYISNGFHKPDVDPYSPLEKAKNLLRDTFKRNSENGTPKNLKGFIIGMLLIALNDPPDIKEALKIFKREKEKFGDELENIEKAVEFLNKVTT